MIFVSLLFSFGGVFVRYAGLMVNSYWISFFRFFIGLLFLLVFMLVTKKKMKLQFFLMPVVFGAVCKSINYLAENYGLSHGYSYGNIILWPVQSVVALIFAIFIFKEKIGRKEILGCALCVAGIAVISWNGRSMDMFLNDGLVSTLLFVAAGAGAAGFVIAQKMLLHKMTAENMNFSMFFISMMITAVPLPLAGEITGAFHVSSLICLLIFGISTGAAFMLIAKAMRTMPLFLVVIIQSSTVLFSLCWAVLFFREPVTNYIIVGSVVFMIGMIVTNIKLPDKIVVKEIGEGVEIPS